MTMLPRGSVLCQFDNTSHMRERIPTFILGERYTVGAISSMVDASLTRWSSEWPNSTLIWC